MRIAVFETLPLGGARRASYELGRLLAERHEVDLYRLDLFRDGQLDLAEHVRELYEYRYEPFAGLLSSRVSRRRLTPRLYTLFGPLVQLHRRIARDIDSRGYDVVLTHSDALTQSPHLLRFIGTPSVYYCHDTLRLAYEPAYVAEHRRRLAALRLGRLRVLEDEVVVSRWKREDLRNVGAATAIAANSRYSQGEIARAYGRVAAICPLGVDAHVFRPGSSPPRDEVLSVGSPTPVKGHQFVVEALARLPTGTRPALRIVMPTPDRHEWLVDLARARGVRVVVESAITELELAERYRSALATCCAARREPFGLTALESMASGTPVIALAEGGFVESIVDGVTGWLVRPEPAEFAARIARLGDAPKERNRLGIAGREHVLRNWDWESAADRTEKLLAEVVVGQLGESGQQSRPQPRPMGAFPIDPAIQRVEAAYSKGNAVEDPRHGRRRHAGQFAGTGARQLRPRGRRDRPAR